MVIKLMRLAGHVARTVEIGKIQQFCWKIWREETTWKT